MSRKCHLTSKAINAGARATKFTVSHLLVSFMIIFQRLIHQNQERIGHMSPKTFGLKAHEKIGRDCRNKRDSPKKIIFITGI